MEWGEMGWDTAIILLPYLVRYDRLTMMIAVVGREAAVLIVGDEFIALEK